MVIFITDTKTNRFFFRIIIIYIERTLYYRYYIFVYKIINHQFSSDQLMSINKIHKTGEKLGEGIKNNIGLPFFFLSHSLSPSDFAHSSMASPFNLPRHFYPNTFSCLRFSPLHFFANVYYFSYFSL